jgi:hypothetical protein
MLGVMVVGADYNARMVYKDNSGWKRLFTTHRFKKIPVR